VGVYSFLAAFEATHHLRGAFFKGRPKIKLSELAEALAPTHQDAIREQLSRSMYTLAHWKAKQTPAHNDKQNKK
jgi:hypothetical protein